MMEAIKNKTGKMEHLFTTMLESNSNGPVSYKVFFADDAYHFKGDGSANEIILRREHDEWRTSGDVSDDICNEAVRQLEAYLLSQH